MFICAECGHVFEDPKIEVERYPYGDTYAEQEFACCPGCGGGFYEAEQCSKCGEWFEKYDLNEGMCNDCVDDIRSSIARAICDLFTQEEMDSFPDDLFDNIWDDIAYEYGDREEKRTK